MIFYFNLKEFTNKKKDLNFDDLPSSDSEDDDFVPPVPSQKRLQTPKKSFSYPRGAPHTRS